MSLSRNQKQLGLLGVLLAVIAILLFAFVFKPPAPDAQTTYTPPKVDTRIPNDLVKRPEYRQLELRVDLPIVPGAMGRDNPFEPY